MSSFTYDPLKTPDAFRLLVLEPGAAEDALHCRIFHATHTSHLDYEALSYTWGGAAGDAGPPAPECFLNGKRMPIRRNLYDAMRHLRWRDYERVLWVDALCIDQSNIGERNHQVGRMREIYSQAERVQVWLGLTSKTSAMAMRWIDESASRHRSSLGVPGRLTDYAATPASLPRSQVARWRALANLLERPYWRRVWIVQEIVLAEKLRLQCGLDEARWEGLTNLLDPRGRKRVFEPRAAKRSIESVRGSLPARIHSLRHSHQVRGCRLQEVLEATRGSLCTDPRDRVYGLLGIADDVGDGRFEVDYSGEPNIDAMLRGLWKYSVECNRPELVVQSCQYLGTRFLHDQATDKDMMLRTVSSQPHLRYQIQGHRVGNVIYLGQPWRTSTEWDNWQAVIGALCERWTPSRMEAQYDMLSKATTTFFSDDHYRRLGLVRRKAFAHLFEQDDEAGPQLHLHPIVEQPEGFAGGKMIPDESMENERFTSSIGEAFGDWDVGKSSRLSRRNVAVMIASNGQMGLVPGRVGVAGVRVGDSLCQFRDSDVTAVFRYMPNCPSASSYPPNARPTPRDRPVLVGKAILAKRPNGEKERDERLGLSYSSLDERYALEGGYSTTRNPAAHD
ncbi:hypothetical protein PG988_003421 [Apiospora saccharicola]